MPSQYFSENKIISNSISLTPKFYYVYKILLSNGCYYIGQTGDLTSRLAQHMFSIYDAKHEMVENVLKFYKEAADLILEEFERYIDELRHIRKSIRVHIIAYVDNGEYAKMIEKAAIRDCKDDPKCLNMRL